MFEVGTEAVTDSLIDCADFPSCCTVLQNTLRSQTLGRPQREAYWFARLWVKAFFQQSLHLLKGPYLSRYTNVSTKVIVLCFRNVLIFDFFP